MEIGPRPKFVLKEVVSKVWSKVEKFSKVNIAPSNEEKKQNDQGYDSDDGDEKILEPLQIIDKTETVLDTILTSKGPIPIDQEDQRYQPYIRRSNHATSSTNGSDHILQNIATTSLELFYLITSIG